MLTNSKEVVMLDFQLVLILPFINDLAIFVSFNLSPENQYKFEDEILSTYYNSMIHHLNGEENFMEFEQMKEYYKLMVPVIAMSILFLVTQDLNGSDREHQIRHTMVENQICFVERHYDNFFQISKKHKIL